MLSKTMPLLMTFLLGRIKPIQTDLIDDTKRLVRSKLDNYDKTRSVLPKSDLSTPIVVTVEAFLLNILYVKETEDSITTYMFFNFQWTDKQLAWNKSEFSNAECIWLPYKNVWLPDLVVINTINNSNRLPTQQDFLTVYHTGLVSWWPGGQLQTNCHIDVSNYPFDSQTCNIELLSWDSDSSVQELRFPVNTTESTKMYTENSNWKLLGVESRIAIIPQVKQITSGFVFQIRMERRATYYILNLILPVIVLAVISLASFMIPPSSGEKMSLCVSTFLTFAIYITIIGGQLPRSSTETSAFRYHKNKHFSNFTLPFVNFTLPFTTRFTILISILQFSVPKQQHPMAFLPHNSCNTPGLASLLNILF